MTCVVELAQRFTAILWCMLFSLWYFHIRASQM